MPQPVMQSLLGHVTIFQFCSSLLPGLQPSLTVSHSTGSNIYLFRSIPQIGFEYASFSLEIILKEKLTPGNECLHHQDPPLTFH